MTPLLIFGTGGHAHDVAEIAVACGYRPVMVARDVAERDHCASTDDIILEDDLAQRSGDPCAIGIGDNRVRQTVAARYRERQFPTLIHPDTSLARGMADALRAVRGTVVFPGVRIMGGCRIGDFCTLNLGCTLSHDCALGDLSNLSPGVHLAGNVAVGEGAWIGMGVVVNQGSASAARTVGAWSTVGSGAAVVRDVPAGAVHAGVPARELRT